MKIFLASDHAGFELKEAVRTFLVGEGREVEDLGAFSLDPADDYTEIIPRAAQAVSDAPKLHKAIVFGLSGQGEAIACNKFGGVRAVVYAGGEEEAIVLSRTHNDANILSLGAKFVPVEVALRLTKLWLDTPFSGDERHVRRIKALDALGR